MLACGESSSLTILRCSDTEMAAGNGVSATIHGKTIWMEAIFGAGGGNRTLTGLPPTDFRTIYGFRRLA